MKEIFLKIATKWSAYHWLEKLLTINLIWTGISNFFTRIFLAYIPGEVTGYLIVIFLSLVTSAVNIVVGTRAESIYAKVLFYLAAVLTVIGAAAMRLHSPLDTIFYSKTIYQSIKYWMS